MSTTKTRECRSTHMVGGKEVVAYRNMDQPVQMTHEVRFKGFTGFGSTFFTAMLECLRQIEKLEQ